MSDAITILLMGLFLLSALWLAWHITIYAFRFGVLLFKWAAEWGWLGFISYVAAWVFMFPIMLIICLIGSLFLWYVDRTEKIYIVENHKTINDAGPNKPLSEAEKSRWDEEDRRHEEAKQKLV